MLEKLSKKFRTRIGGYAILKTIHSLHFMIVNHRMGPGILGRPTFWLVLVKVDEDRGDSRPHRSAKQIV